MATKKSNEYSASNIKSLSARQHVLKRLSLMLGAEQGNDDNPYSSQKNTAIREITDNATDEVARGYGTHVSIKFYKDGSIEVADNGRGLPVDIGKNAQNQKASGIHLCVGELQSGSNFETEKTSSTAGTNGVGVSVTNICSRRFDVSVYRNGKKYTASYQGGTLGEFDGDGPEANFTPIDDLTHLKVEKDTRPAAVKKIWGNGTVVRTWLNDAVFQTKFPYSAGEIIERLKSSAFLMPSLHVEVLNEQNELLNPETGKMEPQKEYYHFDDGIRELVEVEQTKDVLVPVIEMNVTGSYQEDNVPVLQADGKTIRSQTVQREVPISVAFSYDVGYERNVKGFTNRILNRSEGVHVAAFQRAMLKAFNERFSSMRGLLTKKDELPKMEDYDEGLTAVISVSVAEPQFTGQSKEALSGRDVQKAIQDALFDAFTKWIKDSKNESELKTIAKKVTTASKNRQKAREQRDLNRKKNEISSSSLPDKLVDCEFAGRDGAELYLCEGDSALSSLKSARDGRYNALLPLRGKIINAMKSATKQVLVNTEVQDIIVTLGAGSGADFDIDKMRYDRIFIAVDADPDGNAIAVLIYGLFWKFFKEVITQGRLFKLETPLFVITTKGKGPRKYFAKDERERDKIVRRLENKNTRYFVSRLKGLGEASSEVLSETAISPDTRTITQITIDDAVKAEEMLNIVLGTDTNLRKEWIEKSEIESHMFEE